MKENGVSGPIDGPHMMKSRTRLTMAKKKKNEDNNSMLWWCRRLLYILQIYSARLVLEVFGGAGAIWGSMQTLGLRTPENNSDYYWRIMASIVGVLFLIRLLLQIKNDYYVYWQQKERIRILTTSVTTTIPTTTSTTTTTTTAGVEEAAAAIEKKHDGGDGNNYYWISCFMETFAVKFVLEVLGSAGAIWGFSEACTLRRSENLEFWRCIALTIGFIFLVRFLWQIKCYYCYYYNNIMAVGDTNLSQNKDDDDDDDDGSASASVICLLQMYLAKFVLQVLGGGGAIWGFSEVCTLRRAETLTFWRIIALTTATIFLIRFVRQICNSIFMKEDSRRQGIAKSTSPEEKAGRLKLGIAETLEFWHVVAASTATIFLIRFVLQIRDSFMENSRSKRIAKSSSQAEAERLELGITASESSSSLEESTPLVMS